MKIKNKQLNKINFFDEKFFSISSIVRDVMNENKIIKNKLKITEDFFIKLFCKMLSSKVM